jgi:hypothetical protein
MKVILPITVLLSSFVTSSCLTLAKLIKEKRRRKLLNGNETWMTMQVHAACAFSSIYVDDDCSLDCVGARVCFCNDEAGDRLPLQRMV